MNPPRLRKLLSIDGGGVRGLAAIVVLEQLMRVTNAKRREKNLEPQEPWQLFDMIAGTSTGGLIAVMLGRLRMSLKDCKEAYINLSKSVFTTRNLIERVVAWGGLGPKFETRPLQDAIDDILINHAGDGGREALLLENDNPQCKVFVVTHLENITEPQILRSYGSISRPMQQLETMKIWQACRATSAALTFFEPIVVGDSRYSDGGLFYNNPVFQVNIEGIEMFPGSDILIVSLGTGISSSTEFNPNVATIASKLAEIATRTSQVANDFDRTARRNRFYRFDVPEIGDIGLEEANELPRIKFLSEKYLDVPDIGRKVLACAERLAAVVSFNEDLVTEIRGTLKSYASNPRRNQIGRSYLNTFEWIWKRDTGFIDWFENGQGIYWISGRLGAGKSTLMSYMLGHEYLDQHLPSRNDGQTIICNYFFSELSGLDTNQEKSMTGLLHSFLDQLLEKVPELISWIWPTYVNKVRESGSTQNSSSVWSDQNLKEVIRNIVRGVDIACNIILFVDGLDECEGIHHENIEELQSWTKLNQNLKFCIKLCISSRDLPEFEYRLKPYPGLKIHEWTVQDIRIYVEGEINNAFQLVGDRYAPDQSILESELIETVVKNARGVFLWVKLAVSDLVIGIEDCRYATELKDQLGTIPAELEDVYRHLIQKIRPDYLYDAFEYFQVLLKAPGKTYTLTLLQISLATRDPSEALTCYSQYESLDSRSPLSSGASQSFVSRQPDVTINLKQVESRIRSHCRGLIQVQVRKMAKTRWDKTRQHSVLFIHRTVVKYIQKAEVIEGIKRRLSAHARSSIRNPYVLIMASYLRLLKTHPCYRPSWPIEATAAKNFDLYHARPYQDLIVPDHSAVNPVSWDDEGDEFDEKDFQEEKASNNASNAITCFLNFAERAESSSQIAQTAFVDELDRVMSLTNKDWASNFFENRIGHIFNMGDILCLAMCWRLKLYVWEKFRKNECHSKRTRPLFWYAMNPPGWTHDSVEADILRFILCHEGHRAEIYEYPNHKSIGVLEHFVRQVLGLDTNRLCQGWNRILKVMLAEKVQLERLNEVFVSIGGHKRTISHLLVRHIGKHGADQDTEIRKCLEWLFLYGADAYNTKAEGLNVIESARQRGPKAERLVEEALLNAEEASLNAGRTSRKRPRRSSSPAAGESLT